MLVPLAQEGQLCLVRVCVCMCVFYRTRKVLLYSSWISESLLSLHIPSVINTLRLSWLTKHSTSPWQCPAQQQLHGLTCLVACGHVSAWMFTHTHTVYVLLFASMCVWVTLACECARVCDDYKSAFLRRITLVSSVAMPLWMLMDSRCMWVRPFGSLFPRELI